MILYNCRNNSGADKKQITHTILKNVHRLHLPDLKNPQWIIIVEIIKVAIIFESQLMPIQTVCCLTVTNEYERFKKFNIRIVSGQEVSKKDEKQKQEIEKSTKPQENSEEGDDKKRKSEDGQAEPSDSKKQKTEEEVVENKTEE